MIAYRQAEVIYGYMDYRRYINRDCRPDYQVYGKTKKKWQIAAMWR